MGIKPWLIVEKAKTDSLIDQEAILALTPISGLYKNGVSSFVNRPIPHFEDWSLKPTVGFSDIMFQIKGFSIILLAFLGVFLLSSKIRQIFSYFWIWVSSNKLKEFFVFRINIS